MSNCSYMLRVGTCQSAFILQCVRTMQRKVCSVTGIVQNLLEENVVGLSLLAPPPLLT